VEKTLNVAVLGAAGYTGGELLRILRAHPAVGSIRAYSRSAPGRPWIEAHPNLFGEERRLLGGGPEEAASGADVVFSCLPHGESSAAAPWVFRAAPDVLFIDLAGDFRLSDSGTHAQYYGEHLSFELTQTFTYAFPEANRAAIQGARRLCCPGCFATGSLVPLSALAGSGAIAGPIVSFAVTGSSGSGAQPIPGNHHPRRSANICAYKIFTHQHEPEVRQQIDSMGEKNSYRLITHSGPFVRGIFTTIHTKLAPDWDSDRVAGALHAWADKNPFMHLVEGSPNLTPVLGTNHSLIGYSVSEGELILMSTLDNLVKGASGQAVQAMNLALGLEETAGLDAVGFNPY